MLITLPLYILFFLYLIFLAIFAGFSIVNIYHVVATGTFTLPSFLITFFISALTVVTLYFTWYLLQDINWQQPMTLFDSAWIAGVFPS